ncbi:hypothetical protein NKH10_31390 [Mesorhizobium sp. M1340]|uniref:hypothetical protein n=1 Tax=Mesorhizobium sp. M1340 TaxID=2957087 RepID=UPI00333C0DDC
MDTKNEKDLNKAESGTAKRSSPEQKGGDQARKAQEWGGGSKAAKGPITDSNNRNPNSSQRS